jgi:hypothetical protein
MNETGLPCSSNIAVLGMGCLAKPYVEVIKIIVLYALHETHTSQHTTYPPTQETSSASPAKQTIPHCPCL